MKSRQERIRKAIQKALKKPTGPQDNSERVYGDFKKEMEMAAHGELPNRIIGKIPNYMQFISDFVDVFSQQNNELLKQFVLTNIELVYEDKDFIIYLSFMIERCNELGQKDQAKVFSMLLETVMKIGFLYG